MRKVPGARYRKAVGLAYSAGSDCVPTVTTSTELWSADEVVRLARQYRVPVVENAALATALFSLTEGQEIPEELFQAAALVIASIEK